jgi:hypothetical protein
MDPAEFAKIEQLTKEAGDRLEKGQKPFKPFSEYEKYLEGVTMDTGERPLIPLDPTYRDMSTYVPYQTWLDGRTEEIKFAD